VSVLAHDPPTSDRRVLRFVAFAVAIVIGVSALTARLVQLQVLQGGEFATLSSQNSRVIQAIPSSRGLIYDRAGAPLVTNVPSFSVKVRPADLSLLDREAVIGRLAALLGKDPTAIITTIDANPGSRFDAVRVAQDVPESTARTISENHLELPGVEVVVEPRRSYLEGRLVSQLLGYTAPVDAEQLADLKEKGYLPDDLIGKAGVESVYETWLRGSYGQEEVERDARGRKLQVLQTVKPPRAGASWFRRSTLRPSAMRSRDEVGDGQVDIQRGVVIVMNPQTGELLRWSACRPTTTTCSRRHLGVGFQALLEDPGKAPQSRDQRARLDRRTSSSRAPARSPTARSAPRRR
jgi:penicillin-binding protein 2